MLYYDRIDLSAGIDVATSNESKECMVCHDWYFNHGFNFQNSDCNDCHDLTKLCLNLSDTLLLLLKVLIIAVLFMALAKLTQFIF